MMTPSRTVQPDPDIAQYLVDCRMLGHSAKTLRARRNILTLLHRTVRKPLVQCDGDNLLDWYYSYESNPAWTRVTYGRAARSFYSWALRRKLIDHDPSLMLPIPPPPKPSPNPLTPDEIATAVANASPRMRLWLLLAVGAGMRAVEISRMRREHLSRQSGRPVLTIPAGKGDRYRALVISDYLAEQIEAWRSASGRMWDVLPSTVSNKTNIFLHEIGIARTLHKGRHAFGTTFYQATRDLLATADALGHGSVASVQFYAAANPAAYDEALTALDVLLRGEAA